jgi:hypothetical protein
MSQLTGSAGRGLYRHIFRRSEQLANIGPEGLTAGGVYIAGKMSGLPKANYPAFMRAERFLEKHGVASINPARLEQTLPNQYGKQWAKLPKHAGSPEQEMARFEADFPGDIRSKWEAFMKADRELAKQSNLTILMEKGIFGSLGSWRTSAGAKSELALTKKIGSRAVSLESPKDPGRLVDLIHRARVKQGIRSPKSSEYSYGGFEAMKPHPGEGFPGGRSQLFREAMQEVLGLSKEFTQKSAYSAADAAIIKGVTTKQLDLVGLHMAKRKNVALTVTRDPSKEFASFYGEAQTEFKPWVKRLSKVLPGLRIEQRLKDYGLKNDLGIYREAEINYGRISLGKRWMQKRGAPEIGPPQKKLVTRSFSARMVYAHELIELSEQLTQMHLGKRTIGRDFGSHMGKTVISEESRLAVALGEKGSQLRLRTQEWRGMAHPSPTSNREIGKNWEYARGLERMGQVSSGAIKKSGKAYTHSPHQRLRTKLNQERLKEDVELIAFRASQRDARAKGLPVPSFGDFLSRNDIKRTFTSIPEQMSGNRHFAKMANPNRIQSGIRSSSNKTPFDGKKPTGFGSPWQPPNEAAWLDYLEAEWKPTKDFRPGRAFWDTEATGVGSFMSNKGLQKGTAQYSKVLNEMIKQGFDASSLTTPFKHPVSIWEIGYKLPGKHPESIFMKPDVLTMEKGARKMYEGRGAEGKGVLNLFDRLSKGLSLGDMKNATFTSSEKAGIEFFIKQMKQAGLTELAGWNSDHYDLALVFKRASELDIPGAKEFFKKMNFVDYMETSNAVVDQVVKQYKDKHGHAILGEMWDDAKRKGLTAPYKYRTGFMRQENVAKLFGVDYLAHTAANDAGALETLAMHIENLSSSDPAVAAKELNLVNKNIVKFYDAILESQIETGQVTGNYENFAGLQRDALAKEQRRIDSIIRQGFSNKEAIQGREDLLKSFRTAYVDSVRPGTEVIAEAETRRKAKAAIAENGSSADRMLRQAKQAGREIASVIDQALEKIMNTSYDRSTMRVFDFVAKNATKKNAAIAAAAGVAVAAFVNKDKFLKSEGDESDFIDASLLGSTEQDMKQAIMKARNVEALNDLAINRNKRVGKLNALKEGQMIHQAIQESIEEDVSFIAAEMPVQDPELGVKGMVDLVLEIGGEKVPVEVKTVENEEVLNQMTGPKMGAMSQANFYSHVLGSKGAYIVYATREDTEKRKVFYQPYSPGMLVGDVRRFRSALSDAVQDQPSIAHYWSHHMATMGWTNSVSSSDKMSAERLSGIRKERRQNYNGMDTMRVHNELGWPGGREQPYERPQEAIRTSRGRSRIRDQASRNHFSGPGFPKSLMDGNNTVNASRYGNPAG